MLSRNPHFRLILALIVAQLGCLAVGLWLHDRVMVSLVGRATEEEALAELSASVDELLGDIGRLELREPAAGSSGLEQVLGFCEMKQAVPGMRWVVADSKWRILAVHPCSDTEALPREQPGQTLVLRRSLNVAGDDAGRLAGSFTLHDVPYIGVGCPLKGDNGYVIALRPLERVKVAPSVFLDSLDTVGVITWLWTSTLLGIVAYMIAARFGDLLSNKRAQAEIASLTHVQSLTRMRDVLVFGLGRLAEAHDHTTGCHLERVSLYASLVASTLRHHPKYRDVATPEFVRLIGVSSVLHDIGKVAIENAILTKPGPLTEAERSRMEQHTTIGGEYLDDIGRRLGASNSLQMAKDIAISHHERWDGTGYPNGLAGEQIPLAARIVAIADVYEGMSSLTDYKAALPHDLCVDQIVSEAGRQFDPDLVAAFLKVEGSFRQIACQYGGAMFDAAEPRPERPDSSRDWQCTGLFSVGAALQQDGSVAAAPPSQE